MPTNGRRDLIRRLKVKCLVRYITPDRIEEIQIVYYSTVYVYGGRTNACTCNRDE